MVSLGLTFSKQQNVFFLEITNISFEISKLDQENVFAPTKITWSFEPKNCSQPESSRIPFWAGPQFPLNASPTHTPEPYDSVKPTFDLILYVNLILSHGISKLCLQVRNLNISLSDLDSFDLPSLHVQVLITQLRSQARAPSLQSRTAKGMHGYKDLLRSKWI